MKQTFLNNGPVAILAHHRAEARILYRCWKSQLGDNVLVLVAGGDASATRRAMDKVIVARCRCVVNVGLGSGLIAGMTQNDVVLAGSVILPSGDLLPVSKGLLADARAAMRLLKPADRLSQGPIVGVDRLAVNVQEKNTLHAATAAWIADCQIHIALLAAQKADIPFLAIRGIIDDHRRAMPRFLRLVWSRGDLVWAIVMWGLYPAYAIRYRKAMKSLAQAAEMLKPMWQAEHGAAMLSHSAVT